MCAHTERPLLQVQGGGGGVGMSYSESDSDEDDENSLASSAPRSSNAGSPPGGAAGTGPKLRRRLSRGNLVS